MDDFIILISLFEFFLGDSTPRPISKTNDKNDDFENGELYPVQKSPAPPISSGKEKNLKSKK